MKLILASLCLLTTYVNGAPAVNSTNSTNNSTLAAESNPVSNVVTKEDIQGHAISAKKREIPDALVDHPEEFDDSEEDNSRGLPFEVSSIADSSAAASSPFDEVNEYPYFGGEGRRKRTVRIDRAKRGLENMDSLELETLLALLSRNRYFDLPRQTDDWQQFPRREYETPENHVFEEPSEYIEPIRNSYWEEDAPDNQNPFENIAVPIYHNNVL